MQTQHYKIKVNIGADTEITVFGKDRDETSEYGPGVSIGWAADGIIGIVIGQSLEDATKTTIAKIKKVLKSGNAVKDESTNTRYWYDDVEYIYDDVDSKYWGFPSFAKMMKRNLVISKEGQELEYKQLYLRKNPKYGK